jgi:3-hydroxyacyl-CoA dehydrogenase
MNTIGVIGSGFVGSAVVYAFKQDCDVKIFDTDAVSYTHLRAHET